ncbi:MAG: polymer-forming cytoskeletal protein [Anaerolineae bacterium]|nr:polymer-forming cytoskeletal protein [Anaerolineae bacterium]
MIKRRLTWIIAGVAVALLLPVTPVLADDEPPGITIFGEDYTVESGTTIKGNLTVFDGDVIVEDGGAVAGTIVIWGGNAEIEGTVEGDLVVSGGDVYLGDDAWVQGDIVCSWDCSIEQDEDARVDGKIIEGGVLPQIPPAPEIRVLPPMNVRFADPEMVLGPLFSFVRNIISALVVAALAVLVALLLPQQTTRVGQTMTKAVVPSFGYGLLTALAAGAAIILLVLTICLSPIAILAALVLLAAGLYGWICFGAVIGERLLKAFNAKVVEPVWAAGLGTLIVSLIIAFIDAGLSLVCCLEVIAWTAVFVLGCAGLGAVVLTRFGSQPYPPTAESTEEPEAEES